MNSDSLQKFIIEASGPAPDPWLKIVFSLGLNAIMIGGALFSLENISKKKNGYFKISQTKIACDLGIHRTTLSKIVRQMERKGALKKKLEKNGTVTWIKILRVPRPPLQTSSDQATTTTTRSLTTEMDEKKDPSLPGRPLDVENGI